MTKWLLVECFSGISGRVIAVGATPKSFVPLRNILRNPRSLADAEFALTEAVANYRTVARLSADGRRRILAEPLLISPRRAHAVRLWVGPVDEPVAHRDPAGAWYFNLSTHRSVRSEELLDLYGVTPEDRATEMAIAGSFSRLVTNRDESDALAKIVNSAPGTEHQAVWTIRRDDNALRAGHFACRISSEVTESGRTEMLFRGVTQDIGAATSVPAAPPPMILEYQLLEASAAPGEYRGIVNLRSLRLIRWIGEPMPGIAWAALPGEPEPEVHPDDLVTMREMGQRLARERAEGELRVRRLDGGWQAVHLRVALMALDQSTTAALFIATAVP